MGETGEYLSVAHCLDSTISLSNNLYGNADGGCRLLAAYRQAYESSQSAWHKGRQPSGAVLHPSREPAPGELSHWWTETQTKIVTLTAIDELMDCLRSSAVMGASTLQINVFETVTVHNNDIVTTLRKSYGIFTMQYNILLLLSNL